MQEQSIFAEALDKKEPAERAAYLDRACASDPAIRQRIERLLQRHLQADSFLDSPGAALVGTLDEPLTERAGTLIGPYKLLQQIGEGGMGVVYMAEQQEPVRRKVALKIIKPGMDSRQVIARFEAERQALALMDHQNIAKVFGAGATESGRPYFVMELVHGVPLTKYCDDHHLTPRQRLELFIPVCHAVQHAHQKGIIHRDLKPSNLLVTMYDDKPVPKVIDFGVAKAVEQRLTEKTLFTQFGALVGTFEYMSPEQAEMNAFGVDTRSDVYSLGVLLYELLTGSTPLERARLREAAYGEIVRLIKEEEPPRPSTRLSTSGAALADISQQRGSQPGKLTQLVRGELDWIVMRCLEKDRTRRYETANGLARDVERYLKDEPVEACPPTVRYKVRKFARKHHKMLITAAAFAALLLVGVAASAWQAVRATQAEAVAVAERDDKEQARKAEVQHRAAAVVSEQVAQKERDEAQRQRDEVRALNERLELTLYTAHINLAQQAWETGGPAQVRELLEKNRPFPGGTDLRGFEWFYLHRLCHTELLNLRGHTHNVRCVAYSPDGQLLASASNDGTVRVWNAQTGQEVLTIKAHPGEVTSVAFSPDGKRLAGTPTFGNVKVWEAQTGKELLSLSRNGQLGLNNNVTFSADGTRLASGSMIWDAQTGQELLTLQGGAVALWRTAFSPDGKRLVSGTGVASTSVSKDKPDRGEAKVWDAQTGQELFTLQGHTGSITSVAFSPDGTRLASTSTDQTVKVWDAQTGQETLTLKGNSRSFNSVAFSPDGKRLASAAANGPVTDYTVKVWDAQTGQELNTFQGHSWPIYSVAFSPDGKRLASASGDKTVKVWDAQTGQGPLTIKAGATFISCVAFSPDGKRLASGSRRNGTDLGEVKVWDAKTGRELLTLEGYSNGVNSVAFSPDGQRLVSSSVGSISRPGVPRIERKVKVWNAETGQQLLTLQGVGFGRLNENAQTGQVAFSPDGKRLASAAVGNTVNVWDAQTGQKILTFKGHTDPVNRVAFSPDGKRLASGSGKYSSAARDENAAGEVKVWDAQTGQEFLTLKGHTAIINSLAFSPDGKRLASSGGVLGGAAEVMVWDAQTGQELYSLQGHRGYVTNLAFSPYGKRLASSAFDHTVKVWDAQTGQELLTFKRDSRMVTSVAFSPDGHRLASGAADGTVVIWDATPVPEKP